MKARSLFLLFLLCILGTSSFAQSVQVMNQYRVQPDVFHFSEPQQPGVDSQGDLGLSVPIMKIPGRGLDYDITFSYKSGITWKQRSGWIGLGWSFDPGSITRDVSGGAYRADALGWITQGYGVDLFDGTSDAMPDQFYISVPGRGTVEAVMVNYSGFNPGVYPNVGMGSLVASEQNAWKISYELTDTTTNWMQTGIYRPGETKKKPDIKKITVTTEDGTTYIYERPTQTFFESVRPSGNWMVQYHERYVNAWRLVEIRGANYNETGGEPSGSWIKFTYTDVPSYYDWIRYKLIETVYLTRVDTPTHYALLNIAETDDAFLAPEEEGLYRKLTSIQLYSKMGSSNGPIEEVVLSSTEGGLWPHTSSGGKLRLDEILFYGKDHVQRPGYKFEYSFNPECWGDEDYTGLMDDSGYYKGVVSGSTCSIGVGNVGGWAWSMTAVVYPTGAREEFVYESDRVDYFSSIPYDYADAIGNPSEHYYYYRDNYGIIDNRNTQGGGRIKSIRRFDGMGSYSDTRYEYPDGDPSGIPSEFWYKWALQEASRTGRRMRMFAPPDRGKTSVYYEWVKKISPDGGYVIDSYVSGNLARPIFFQHGSSAPCTFIDGLDYCYDFAVMIDNYDQGLGEHTRRSYHDISGNVIKIESKNFVKSWSIISWVWGSWSWYNGPGRSIDYMKKRLTYEYVDDYTTSAQRRLRKDHTYDDATGLLKSTVEYADGAPTKETRITYAREVSAYKSAIEQAHTLDRVAGQEVLSGSNYLSASVTTWKMGPNGRTLVPATEQRWHSWSPWTTSPVASFAYWSGGTGTPWILATNNEAYDQHGHVIHQTNTDGTSTYFYYGENVNNTCTGAIFPNCASYVGLKNAYLTGVRVGDFLVRTNYDPLLGKPSSFTDENNVASYFNYDAFGQLVATRNPDGENVTENKYFYSRSQTGSFNQASPNSVMSLKMGSGNLVNDWSAETTSGSDPNTWTTSVSGGVATISNSVSFAGSRSLQSTVTGASRALWLTWYSIPVDPNKWYHASVWVKTSGGYTGGAYFSMYFRNQVDAYVDSVGLRIPAGDRDWTLYSMTFKPPTNSVKIYAIYLNFRGMTGTAGTVNFDAVQLHEAPQGTIAYSDGLGREIQTQSLIESGQVSVAARTYDANGREHKLFKAYPKVGIGYDQGFATNASSHYNGTNGPNAYGRPYAEKLYLADPLGRVREEAPVGVSPGTANTRTNTYSIELYNGAYYTYVESKDEAGHKMRTYTDPRGKTVLLRRIWNDESVTQTPASVSVSARMGGIVVAGYETEPAIEAVGGGGPRLGGTISVMKLRNRPFGIGYPMRRGSKTDSKQFSVPYGQTVTWNGSASSNGSKANSSFIIYRQGDRYNLLANVSCAGSGCSQTNSGSFVAQPGIVYIVESSASTLLSGESASGSGSVQYTNRTTTVAGSYNADTRFEYDALGNLTRTIAPKGDVTDYVYNTLSQLLQKTSPDEGTTKYRYDRSGRLRFQETAQQVAEGQGKYTYFAYDGYGRLTQEGIASDGSWNDYLNRTGAGYAYSNWTRLLQYDTDYTGEAPNYAAGRLTDENTRTEGSNQWVINRYKYDRLGNTTLKWAMIDGTGILRTYYTYDRVGNVLSTTYPSGAVVTQTHAENGQVRSARTASEQLATFSYTPERQLRQAVLGGSAVTGDYTYDKDSRPANIRFNASGALQYESTYQWAADGNLRSQSSTNGTHGGGTVIASYFHDSLDRIMNAFYDGAASKSEGWRYDLNGNITSFTQNGSTATYTYGDGARVNRLSGVSGRFTRSYGYDASGRITGDGLRTFAYEHMGRVMSLWKSGYGTESYLYDGAGLRVKEVTPTGTTFNIRGLSGEVLAEYNASGGLVAEYYYAGAQRVALRKGSTTQYYLTDHLGSARRLYPVVSNWSADYYAFGEIEEQRGTEGEPTFDYTGQERDFGTGVMYYGARYYDPQVGRFLQVDPRVDKYRGWSPYNYALNNPLLYVDPQGDTVRVYVETQGVGHSWLSIGEGDNMVVYTYGRYAGTKDGSSGGTPLSNGPGVMVRLEGKDAAAYNASKLDAEGFAGFKILDVTDQDVGKIMEQRFASSTEMPTTGEYANDPRAHVIDDYNILSNNCTTNVSDALNSAGSRALERGFVVRRTTAILRQTQRFVNPASLGSHLKAKTIYPGY